MVRTKKKNKSKKPELAGTRVSLKFKKHVIPPLGGLLVAVLVFGFFNSQLLSGRIAYYLNDHNGQKTVQDNQVAAASTDKNAPPKLIINSIKVTAPVIFDQTTINEGTFQKALHNGVVHYPNTANPGQTGNVVIFGHSSGQWWAPGNYKFIFTLLDKVKIEDRIYLEYQGTRYIYRVYNTKIVQPTDLSVLNQSSNHMLTLLTCTPVGTSSKRLVIQAQQIIPAVSNNHDATQAAMLPTNAQGSKLPSQGSSFWTDLKSLF